MSFYFRLIDDQRFWVFVRTHYQSTLSSVVNFFKWSKE